MILKIKNVILTILKLLRDMPLVVQMKFLILNGIIFFHGDE